eukprot:gene25555-11203_t
MSFGGFLEKHLMMRVQSSAWVPVAWSLPMQLDKLASILQRVESFYDGIGGIVGYHAKSLQLIAASSEPGGFSDYPTEQQKGESKLHVPKAVDLTGEQGMERAQQAVAQGIRAMPYMAEVYPVGGAGDRLGLCCDVTGECLPAAMLKYCGRTMLEGLIRDLQGREFLYYKLTGTQLTTPVAIMTSDAKGNHSHIQSLLDEMDWFGRGKDSFKLFRQPLVPVISVEDGRWLLADPLKPMLKPGGHGAIWKLMLDEGVFDWLGDKHSRRAALVRQISNPMAGSDSTLLALAGCGDTRGASFGFMSCDRHVGAAEGMNVLQESKRWTAEGWKYDYGVSNIEYTEFERLGITDQAVDGCSSTSCFPANTNVLYVGLSAAEAVVKEAVATSCSEKLMPGLIFNLKKMVNYLDPLSGVESKVRAGRMECTMQNMADYLVDSYDTPLDLESEAGDSLSTFLVYNSRQKVTSSAKKKREPGVTKIAQTPDGSFYDLQRNALSVLDQCGMSPLPDLGSVEEYLQRGPGGVFLFHPALGPLWNVIAQKIEGGSMAQGSELVLEVAEIQMKNVQLSGSLRVHANNLIGHSSARASFRGETSAHATASWEGIENGAPHHLDGAHTNFRGETSAHAKLAGESSARTTASWEGVENGAPHHLHPLGTEGKSNLKSSVISHNTETYASQAGARSSSSEASFLDSLASIDLTAGSSEDEATDSEQRLHLSSSACGRVRLNNVVVQNKSVNWEDPSNLYWKHQLTRHEGVEIKLLGRSEFEAADVTLMGSHTFEVPNGYRMVVSEGASGNVVTECFTLPSDHPTWEWQYNMTADGAMTLDCITH